MPRFMDQKKKQFGQNLNKLVVKPPPVVGSGNGQRNGLLLLSAAKKEGGLLSTPSETTSSIAPIKPHESANASTHDVLLSAVTGKAERDSKQLDAWGIADKAQSGGGSSAEPKNGVKESTPLEKEETENPKSHSAKSAKSASWDDYGGRESLPQKNGNNGSARAARKEVVDQASFMSRLAKERSSQLIADEKNRERERRERAAARLKELDDKRQAESDRPSKLWEPTSTGGGTANAKKAESSTAESETVATDRETPVIQLSSYEDRDRGERQNSTVPRMLYDPKSGSMVAVKLREEKKKLRTRKTKKERKESKEETKKTVKTRKETETVLPEGRRYPRTCGVLYERDDGGQIKSADGCEGDLGYGAHSVPGGRIRNAEAYAELLASQESKKFEGDNPDDNENRGPVVQLETGFRLTDDDEDPVLEPLELVTADDKLELVTGDDDSPTLKPTAKVWAPSEAVIAAAMKAAEQNQANGESDDEDDDLALESVETDEDDTGSVGLGFDPAFDMDGLIQSPHSSGDEADDLVPGVDLDALKLEPDLFATDPNPASNSAQSNIFVFGSSGTWGAKSSNHSGSDDWAMPTSLGSVSAGLFGGIDSFAAGASEHKNQSSPFLGGDTWGASSALGGLTLNRDRSNAASGD